MHRTCAQSTVTQGMYKYGFICAPVHSIRKNWATYKTNISQSHKSYLGFSFKKTFKIPSAYQLTDCLMEAHIFRKVETPWLTG